MSEYLSPAEVDDAIDLMVDMGWPKTADTLREMAAIVAAVAEGEWWLVGVGMPKPGTSSVGQDISCIYCDGGWASMEAEYDHDPDCIYLRARKLMGHAE